MSHDLCRSDLLELARALGLAVPPRWTIRALWRQCLERSQALSAAERERGRVVQATAIGDVTIEPSGVRIGVAACSGSSAYWGTIPPEKARALALQILATWPDPNARVSTAPVMLDGGLVRERLAAGGCGGSDRDANPDDYCSICGRTLAIVDEGDGSPLYRFCPSCEPDVLAQASGAERDG